MKAPLIAFSCVLLGAAACTAPHGKKLASSSSANTSGLAPVAEGPGGSSAAPAPVASGPATPAAQDVTVTEGEKGKVVSVYSQGTLTVTLSAAREDGYVWRLSEIPDASVLKLVSEGYTPPPSGQGRGEEKWVFQAVGPGDVNVKMWYGNTRESSLSGNPSFDFVASVSDQTKPEQKPPTTSKKSPKKA